MLSHPYSCHGAVFRTIPDARIGRLKSCGCSVQSLRACLKMGRGSAAGEFWVGQGGERRGRPPAVCSARTNAVQAGKTRRPVGLGGKGPLAALLVGHRPLRVRSLLAPCQSNPSLPNRTPPHFQTGSKPSGVWRSSIGLLFWEKAEDSRKTPRSKGRESHTRGAWPSAR